MKESGKDRLKSTINESTLSTAARSPFPDGEGCDTRIPLFSIQRLSQGGRQRGGGFAAKNEANPASLRSAAPSKERGSRGQLPPSFGRRCPEGAEVGWGWRYEREGGNASQVDDIREHPIHRCAVPLPQWGRLRNEDAAFLALSERIHAYVGKKNNDGQSLPRVGKVASGASRIGY